MNAAVTVRGSKPCSRQRTRSRRLNPALSSSPGITNRRSRRSPNDTTGGSERPTTRTGSHASVRRASPGTGSVQKPIATSSRWLSSSRQRLPVVASRRVDLDPRMPLAQPGEERRAELVARRGRAPEPQRAEHPSPRACGIGERVVDRGQGDGAVGDEPPARVGERDAAGRAREQLDAELGLELADGLAQRRGRHVQPVGRAREVELLGDDEEVAQVTQLGRHASIMTRRVAIRPAIRLSRRRPRPYCRARGRPDTEPRRGRGPARPARAAASAARRLRPRSAAARSTRRTRNELADARRGLPARDARPPARAAT